MRRKSEEIRVKVLNDPPIWLVRKDRYCREKVMCSVDARCSDGKKPQHEK